MNMSLILMPIRFALGLMPQAKPTHAVWSETVDGLQARLVVEARKETLPGTMLPDTYLELHNTSDANDVLEFDFKPDCFRPVLIDGTRRRLVGPVMGPASGFSNPFFRVSLPRDGTLRFPMTWKGYGIAGGMGVVVCLPRDCWSLPVDGKADYFLGGTLVVEKGIPVGGIDKLWHGALKLPAVKVPVSEKE